MDTKRVGLIFDNELRAVWRALPIANQDLQLLNFLLNHERKQVCLDKLSEQIVIAEKRFPNMTEKEFTQVIRASAQMFSIQAANIKQFEILSRNEQDRLTAKHNRLERLKSEADAESVSVTHWLNRNA